MAEKKVKKHVSKKAPKKGTTEVKAVEEVKETVEAAKAVKEKVEEVKKAEEVKAVDETKVEKEKKAETKEKKKTTTKKTAAKADKKTATKKKEAAKMKTTIKKVPKNVFVEHFGQQTKIDVEKYEGEVKKIWLNDWNRLAKDLKEIDLYIKIEDKKVYFVVNGTEHGDFSI